MAEQKQNVITPGHCILFSTADWHTPYWTNKQYTTRLLAKRGWSVLYVESVGLRSPSFASGRDWGRLFRRLLKGIRATLVGPEKVENNVWVLPPLMLPGKHHLHLIRAFNQGLLRLTITRFLKRNKFIKPLVWTYHPFMLDAIEGLETGQLVYHCVDDLAAVPGVEATAFNLEEIRLLKKCTAVFTTAESLKEKCLPYNANTHFHSNVVDAEHFGKALQPGPLPLDLESIPEPRLVYHGVLSDFKLDFELILQVARLHPEWQWVFIGEEREGQNSSIIAQLKQLPNVHFLGYRSYAVLPDYLRGMVIGLLPTLLNDYTRSMFPMKYYEYLAAGLPIVSTPLEFTAMNQAGLLIAYDAESFEKSLIQQLQHGKLTAPQACELVGNNTWDARLDNMLAKLGYK